MKPWEIWLSHISTFLVAVSGGAYFWMKYMMETDDPFSLVNHLWQPTMLSLHVLTAPFLVFAVGLMVGPHIRKQLQGGSKSNRRTGIASTLALPVMIVSGYMLQVVTALWLAKLTLLAHLASSSIFAVTYVIHQVISFRLSRRAALGERPGLFVRKGQVA